MFAIPWRSPFLAWLEEVQAASAIRSYGPGPRGARIYMRLRTLHREGCSVQNAVAWLREEMPDAR